MADGLSGLTRRTKFLSPVFGGFLLDLVAVGLAADLHLAAAIPVAKYVEYLTPAPYIDDIITQPFQLDADGLLTIPTSPGLGVELNRDALRRFSGKSSPLTSWAAPPRCPPTRPQSQVQAPARARCRRLSPDSRLNPLLRLPHRNAGDAAFPLTI